MEISNKYVNFEGVFYIAHFGFHFINILFNQTFPMSYLGFSDIIFKTFLVWMCGRKFILLVSFYSKRSEDYSLVHYDMVLNFSH